MSLSNCGDKMSGFFVFVDFGSRATSNSVRSSSRTNTVGDVKKESPTGASTTVGRQTNNSLASATGQIVIQPVSNPHRKKLKTSQVYV